MAKKTSPSSKDVENPEFLARAETQKEETAMQAPSASAMRTTAEGIEEEVAPSREDVGEFLPMLRETLSKAVYTTCYSISYGVVFGGLVIGSLLPKGSLIHKGVCDGAESAARAFRERWEEKSEGGEVSFTGSEGMTAA
jgi:hypothetical protein